LNHGGSFNRGGFNKALWKGDQNKWALIWQGGGQNKRGNKPIFTRGGLGVDVGWKKITSTKKKGEVLNGVY